MRVTALLARQGMTLTLMLLLTACVTAPPRQGGSISPPGRYELENDVAELEPLDLDRVTPVVPRAETRTIAGNKSPYTVNGRTYHVMNDERGYSETGLASWYGRKFHGHLTSNGEIYDMFQLSAAHTRLPIPSYIRVTNLDNGRSIITRVNDRGPFHPGRIVDLSYAGAVMLGYADKGTARVRVEAVLPGDGVEPARTATAAPAREPAPAAGSPAVAPAERGVEQIASERQLIEAEAGLEFLQIGAFTNIDSARALVGRLDGMTALSIAIHSDDNGDGRIMHRVRIGPLSGGEDVQGLVNSIEAAGMGRPFRVRI